MDETKKKVKATDILPFLSSIGKEEIKIAQELMLILDNLAAEFDENLKAENILIWWLVRNETARS